MINKVILQGRFTKKPEAVDKGGFLLCDFTIAWSEKIKDTEKVCFMDCKAWRGTAEFISKYFDKGQECIVEGQLLQENWEKDGQKFSRKILNVEKVHFCGSKSAAGSNKAEVSDDFMKIPEGMNEELPFN